MDSGAPEFFPTSAAAPVGSSRPLSADVGKSSQQKRAKNKKHKPQPNPGLQSAPKTQSQVMKHPKSARPKRPVVSDQCQIISDQIRRRELECVICMNVIGWKGKIWTCGQCRQPLHLSCIQNWRTKSGESWPCPACNYLYTTVPRYFCFCGKVENPNSAPGLQPHSCGETCGRVRGPNCPHLCPLLCHPGQCPSCTSLSPPIHCYCGKQTYQVLCKDYDKPKSCGQSCGKLLTCNKHRCGLMCHEGPCADCTETKSVKCYCGKTTRGVPCAINSFSCQQPCDKPLSCKLHSCDRNCHMGSCGRCPRDPELVKYCPCGKNLMSLLLIEERKSCADPIPTCHTPCQQLLPCGHPCQAMCHFGRCPPCKEKVTVPCRCNSSEVSVTCSDSSEAKCHKVCKTMKSCNKHKCDEVCCPERGKIRNSNGKHLCFEVCNKSLACGLHSCPLFCHLGNCDSCKVIIREPISCACGGTVRQPPIRCGSDEASFVCPLTCGKVLECGHKCRAKCHFNACPPCLELTTKPCRCGKEFRDSIPCSTTSVSCGKICLKIRPCGHKCNRKCHADECGSTPCVATCDRKKADCEHACLLVCHGHRKCPDQPCQAILKVTCPCGAQSSTCVCSKRIQKVCDSDCERIQRNARLALALSTEKRASETYDPELIQFAIENLEFVKKVEKKMDAILASKATTTLLPPMNAGQRAFCHDYLTSHYEVETEAVDKEPNRTIVVYMNERARRPVPLISALHLSNPDQVSSEPREVLSSLLFYQLQMQDTSEELKSVLQKFAGEFHVKWLNDHSALACFYNLQRCVAAKEMLEAKPGPFSICKIVHESKLPKPTTAPPKKFSNSRKKAKEVAEFSEEGKPVIEEAKIEI